MEEEEAEEEGQSETTSQTKTNKKEWKNLHEQGYIIEECFYEGRYSKICKAAFKEVKGELPNESISLVCKIIRKDVLPQLYGRKLIPMQLEILSRLAHHHIVTVHSILASELRYFLFMEPCEVGNLFDFLRRYGPLPFDLTKLWYRQLLQGVMYCHSAGIAHRNITVKNILITATREIRLTGFDFSTILSRQGLNRTICGSVNYVPPEILAGVMYDPRNGDVWCLGIVLIYITTRIFPFPEINPHKLLKMQKVGLRKSHGWSTFRKLPFNCRETAESCLKLNPAHRPKVADLLAHAWLRQDTQPGQSRASEITPEAQFDAKEAKMSLSIAAGIVTQIQKLNPRKFTVYQNLGKS